MKRITADQVRAVMLASLETQLAAQGLQPQDIRDDFDLLTEGVIDSLGLIELIANIEKHLGIEVDFEDLDPENLTVVGPFCRYIEEKSNMEVRQA